MIKVDNLSKNYRTRPALKGISFEVPAGEIFGYLGTNGAGKTTTIKILTGQLRASSGKAWLGGREVGSLGPADNAILGVVFEEQNLYLRLSAYDNLKLFAELFGVKPARIPAALAAVGLEAELKTTVGAFSKGMKQRLMLARALLHEPRVLFLDEPTNHLDPQTRHRVHQLIAGEARDKGTTVFLSTHNLEEAERLCGRVAIIHHGEIIALDTPAALKAEFEQARQVQGSLYDAFLAITDYEDKAL